MSVLSYPLPAFSSLHQSPATTTSAALTFAAPGLCRVPLATLRRSDTLRASLSSPELQVKPAAQSTARRAAVASIKSSSCLTSSLAKFEGVLKVQDLNSILRFFGESKRWEDASEVFEWMKKQGRVTVASYSTYIKILGKSHSPNKALQVYSSINDDSLSCNVSVCNSILSCLVRNGKLDGAFKLFDQMKLNGLVPDVITYSTLLSGCAKIKDGFPQALKLVCEMESNDLKMDDVIYGSLIAVCASNNLVREAEDYFQQMRNEGHVPNIFHYSSLLNAYSLDGNYKDADKLLDDMKSAGLVPNKVMLTTLLKVYARGGLFDKSRDLLAELEKAGFAEEEMPYCSLMDGLAKAGHINDARAIFDDMKSKNVKSNGYAHSIMICAYCRYNRVEEAADLAKDFEASHNKYDIVMLNSLLTTYCRTGKMDLVMELLKKMDKLTISPDVKTFHILVKYFMKEKLYDLALRTVQDMYSKGCLLDEELCSNLIMKLGEAGSSKEAFAVYNMLRYGKRTLWKDLHEKVLHILILGGLLKEAYIVMKDYASFISRHGSKKFTASFVKSGNINMLNDVLKTVHNSGHEIHQDVFQLAIWNYIKNPEKKELLIQLLQWMAGQGYVVSSTSRNLLLKNSNIYGRQLLAEILSKQHSMSKLRTTSKKKI